MTPKTKTKSASVALVPTESTITHAILEIRGRRVILDADLARVYGIQTRALVQAVKRNAGRFPDDFMFRLNREEVDGLRSQVVISKPGRGGRRFSPYAFTEHGAIMAANVLRSERAIEASVYVVRAFVRLREAVAAHKDLALKIEDLERRYATHDAKFKVVFDALRQILTPPVKSVRRIGFARSGNK